MSKKQFTLDSWLKDKRQKVVTRCGFPVRIVCTDVKRKDYPILALVERDDQEEYQSFTKDGRFSLYNSSHDSFDLFIETADEVSEDEKIRKDIINYFRCQSEEEPTRKEIHNKWIAWLEKQKEYESTDFEYVWDRTDCGELTAALDKYSEEAIINMCHAWYDKGIELERKSWLEKQGEKLPAGFYYVNSEGKKFYSDTFKYGDVILHVEKQSEPKTKENKGNIGGISPVWSEEDEAVLDALIRRLEGEDVYVSPHLAVECLKSLKGRVLPKQEWSEEDEQHIDSLLKRLDALCRNKFERTRFAISEDRDWLKSLRPQNRWKPSEDDIIILEKLIKGELEPKVFQATLQGILEQLKKLKEG